jgi:hypothetical protein
LVLVLPHLGGGEHSWLIGMYHLGGYDPFGGLGRLPRSQLPLPFHLPLPPRCYLACLSRHRRSCPYPDPLPGCPQEVDEPKLSYLVCHPIDNAAPCHWPKLRLHGLGYLCPSALLPVIIHSCCPPLHLTSQSAPTMSHDLRFAVLAKALNLGSPLNNRII